MSGLGKGIAAASIGHLLSSRLRIIPIKCDGYLNVDPGTMNPIEHGEVFVLDDGGEVDMDFGHYERFLGVNCKSKWNLTMGKVFHMIRRKERRCDYLGKTVQYIPHVTDVIKNHFFQKIDLKKVETDLNELIGSSLSCLNGRHTVSIFKDLQPVPRLMIDPEQVQKVLMNLILNANEALVNGGEIQVASRKSDGWAIVSVRDNGCGMTKEFIEKSLFRPFKTTKKQGMGIGLFQSKMIIEAHQGRIEVESEEGKGTVFRIILPILKE